MAPVTDKGEDTRRRIIDTAAAAFVEGGFAGTSLNDLLRSADITKGGFYFHFASKEELALAVIDTKKAQVNAQILAAIDEGAPPLVRLESLVRAAFASMEQDNCIAVVQELSHELSADPELAARFGPPTAFWTDITLGLLREAQTEGTVDAALDATSAATVAVAAFFGLTMTMPGPYDRLIEPYLDFIFHGIGAVRG